MSAAPPPPEIPVSFGPAPGQAIHPLLASSGEAIVPATTRVAFSASREGLTVLYEADADPPLEVRRTHAQEPVYEDECVELFWEGDVPDGLYTEIVVNPLGTVYSARIDNPDGDRRTWKVSPTPLEGLEIRVEGTTDAAPGAWRRWTCLLRAPWSALTPGRPAPVPGSVHRGNVFRIARGRVPRFEALSPTLRTPPDFHVPARFVRFPFLGL